MASDSRHPRLTFRSLYRRVSDARSRMLTHSARLLRLIADTLKWLTYVSAIVCLVILIISLGFDHRSTDILLMRRILRGVQAVFISDIVFGMLFVPCTVTGRRRWLMRIVNCIMLLTVLPWIYPNPAHPWIPVLRDILYSGYFLYSAMAAYACIRLCQAVMGLAGRRTNPALLMASAFLFFITVGAFILMMPKCTYDGISFVDSFFVSTSAVCITGLTTVDIPSTFTPLGQTVLVILFQIGGLGVITFTSFFAIFFTGAQSIYSQLLVRDMVYSKTMNALGPTLLYILVFTLTIEAVGSVALYFALPPELCADTTARVRIAVFHSMSAFCNVGFSNIPGGMSNAVLMGGNQAVYILMSLLLFAGAVGFPILVNFRYIFHRYLLRLGARLHIIRLPERRKHIFDLNTKVVLVTTITVFLLGATAFFVLESDNTMRGMPLSHRIVQSAFNALIPRSGGYSTVDPGAFLDITLLIVVIQMWIGGASQSMAGGVKVNTIGAILINLRAIVRQSRGVAVFHRNISVSSVRRANAVVTLSIISLIVFSITLLLLEPQLSAKAVLFEVVSAVFSVGSSLGVTPVLSPVSKFVICVAMFIGRVGLLSLLTGIFAASRDQSAHYPTDLLIIN